MKARKRRFAAIDLGTNTILLFIAETKGNGSFTVLEDRGEITRLGEGVDRSRELSEAAQRRSLEVLRDFCRIGRGFEVDEIALVGTSALRDAANAESFAALLKRELGLNLRILSGEEEALYSYLAVRNGLEIEGENVLVVDIGGGSTELIWGRGGTVQLWTSLQMGTVRLTERFLVSDPVREEECARLVESVDHSLDRMPSDWKQAKSFDFMAGVAGTFTTLAAVALGLERYSHSEVHGSSLSRREIDRQIVLFKSKTVAERRRIPGLEPKRADVILAGALLAQRILDHFCMNKVVVSDKGVRYGLWYEKLSEWDGQGRDRNT